MRRVVRYCFGEPLLREAFSTDWCSNCSCQWTVSRNRVCSWRMASTWCSSAASRRVVVVSDRCCSPPSNRRDHAWTGRQKMAVAAPIAAMGISSPAWLLMASGAATKIQTRATTAVGFGVRCMDAAFLQPVSATAGWSEPVCRMYLTAPRSLEQEHVFDTESVLRTRGTSVSGIMN